MAATTELNCPSCGGQIQIANRFVQMAVCPYCAAAVIVDEKVARVAGQMATLPADDSPLYLGATGRLGKRPFRVLGRVRYGYDRGYWDEWYVSFDEGQTRWISIDGREYQLEELTCVKTDELTWDQVKPGQIRRIGKDKFQVREKAVATCEGGEGQLPFKLLSGEQVPYVDLRRKGASGTIEFEPEGLRVFLGRPFDRSLLKLDVSKQEAGVAAGPPAGFQPAEGTAERVVRGQEDRSRKVNCRSCGAPLELPGPGVDRIECTYCGCPIRLGETMITCPSCGGNLPLQADRRIQMIHCAYCGAQLDISDPGEPDLLEKILLSDRPEVPFALGTRCTFDQTQFEIVGHIRCQEQDGWQRYFWDDFLLYEPEAGYRWLSLENGHATLAEAIPGDVPAMLPSTLYPRKVVAFEGRSYKVFEISRDLAKICYVDGEMPWVAKVGDPVNYADAVSPPMGLTVEWSASEVEYFRSVYVSREELIAAFAPPPEKLPPLMGVAPTQPFVRSVAQRQFAAISGAFAAVFLLLTLGSWLVGGKTVATFKFDPGQYAQEAFTDSFRIEQAPTVCQAKLYAPLRNSWVYLDLGLVDDQDRVVLDFSQQVSYYSGSDWTEGRRSGSTVFRVDQPGAYRLLIKAESGGSSKGRPARLSGPVRLTVRQGVLLSRYFLLMTLAGLAYPVWSLVRKFSFENRRWAEADDVDDDDDDDDDWE